MASMCACTGPAAGVSALVILECSAPGASTAICLGAKKTKFGFPTRDDRRRSGKGIAKHNKNHVLITNGIDARLKRLVNFTLEKLCAVNQKYCGCSRACFSRC